MKFIVGLFLLVFSRGFRKEVMAKWRPERTGTNEMVNHGETVVAVLSQPENTVVIGGNK